MGTPAESGGRPAAPARRGLSIRARIALYGLAVSLLPVLGLGWLVLDINETALRRTSLELHLAIVSDVRRTVRGRVDQVREELTGVAHLLFGPGDADDAQRLALAGSRVSASEQLDFVAVYDAQGKLAGALKAGELPDPQLPDDLPPRLRGEGPGPFVGEARPGPAGPGFDLAIPVRTDGELRGWLATNARLEPLSRLLRQIGEERLGSPAAITVVDEQRRVVASGSLARTVAREGLAGRDLFASFPGPPSFRMGFGITPEYVQDGIPMVGAFETIPELGWAIIAGQTRARAFAEIGRLRRTVAASVGAASLLALVAAILIARRLTRPIAQLAASTQDLAGRRFQGVPPEVSARADELGALGRAFDGLGLELERSQKRLVEEARVRGSLARYLAPEVVDLVVADRSRLRLSGERREVTVLFADVVSFTRLAQAQPPETVVSLLNELFTIATEIVHRRGGIVDKFVGDCVMGVWGAPQAHDDDAVRAVAAADDLRRWADTANRRWRQVYGVRIELAMGLHTGAVVAGNLGSEKRLEYTVVGDTVNLASRLEGRASPGQILVSAATRARLGDAFELRPLGEVELAGHATPVAVWEVAP